MIQQIAQQVSELQRSYEQGIISADEYRGLISTMNLVSLVNDQTACLEENLMYRQIIVGAIQLASALG